MPIFETHNEDSIYLSMHDTAENLSRTTNTPFKLDEQVWPTVEHYYQSMKFVDNNYTQQILTFATPTEVSKFADSWLRKFKIRKDWSKIKTTVMTRAIYIKCRTYPEIAKQLITTADKKLVENSQFDYFWGCGRDKRGHNHYGKVLMNVRDKLQEELLKQAY
jgi:ribA/ribD-fused uncharacterized protein